MFVKLAERHHGFYWSELQASGQGRWGAAHMKTLAPEVSTIALALGIVNFFEVDPAVEPFPTGPIPPASTG